MPANTAPARSPRSRGRGLVSFLVVLALVAGGVATWRYDLLDDVAWPWADDGGAPADPDDPSAVAPPPGLDLPPVTEPAALAAAWDDAGRIDRRAVRAALEPVLKDSVLGPDVLAMVAPLGAGPAFTYERGGDDTAIPASTTKLATTTAALLTLGPEATFNTTAVLDGRRDGVRRLVLVGGGDPLLMAGPTDADGKAHPYPHRATLQDLAEAAADALARQGVKRVSLGYDTSLFAGPAENPTWKPTYVDYGTVSPISSLWVDEGRTESGGRVTDAPATAADAFAAALQQAGVDVVGSPAQAEAGGDAELLAEVTSAPVREIVERILTVSDNEAAEVLLRQIALDAGRPGSTTAGLAVARTALEEAGLDLGPSRFADGSGLSRDNTASPELLVDLLRLAASPDHPELRPVLTGLPVAGFNGSLASRFDTSDPASFGTVRAKTGSLDSVRALAGVTTGADGVPMLFAIIVNGFDLPVSLEAWDVVDEAAGALAACSCGAG